MRLDEITRSLTRLADKANINAEERAVLIEAKTKLTQKYAAASHRDYDYPQNVYFEIGLEPIEFNNISNDGYEYVLNALSEKEKEVLELRFQKGYTYDAVGQILGVSKERIRQIEQKALRKLRHPSYERIILEGKAAIDEYNKAKRTLAAETTELNREIVRVMNNKARFKQICDNYPEVKSITGSKAEGLYLGIDSLGLTKRAYNCLKLSGYKKVKDLSGVTVAELKKIRNMGEKTIIEVIDKLHRWGIEVTDEKSKMDY